MIENRFSRNELLFGMDICQKIKNASVAVFGIGGVGGHCTESLVRAGIGNIYLFDNDIVSVTNINRQIIATTNTIGLKKVEVMKDRILSINPDANVYIDDIFFLPETANKIDFSKFDYVVDAIDTVSGKIELVIKAQEYGKKIISCMGTGNKFNPTMLEVSDIYKTSVCPLAKVMRKELKKRGVKQLRVVYSKEEPKKIDVYKNEEIKECEGISSKRAVPGSNSFVPSVAGIIIASEIIKDIMKE